VVRLVATATSPKVAPFHQLDAPDAAGRIVEPNADKKAYPQN
jgi:hypothetical protein